MPNNSMAQEYFEVAGVILLVIDSNETVIRINKKGCEVLGYSKEEIVGKNWVDTFIPENDRDESRLAFQKLITGQAGAALSHVNSVLTKSGEERIIEWQKTMIHDEEGRILILSSGKDITELRRMEREKHDFYAMVAHDFNQPLSIVMGYSQVLSSKPDLDPEMAKMIDSIKRGARKIHNLVNDFLALSQLEAGRLTLKLSLSDLRSLLKEIQIDMERIAQEKGVTLETQIADLPSVFISKELMQRAVCNLLQNAINFTQVGGTVRFEANLTAEEASDLILISISDNGPGIAREEQGRIFEKYYRSARTSDVKGTGLGLPIVKAVAEAHGGRVEVESEPGKGSTFRLYLPLARIRR